MEAVEADDEGRRRIFLDANAARRPAPEIAAPAAAAPAVGVLVKTVGGAHSSRRSSTFVLMEAEHEENQEMTVEFFSASGGR